MADGLSGTDRDALVAATLAAALGLTDVEATVKRYREILAELRRGGGAAMDSKGDEVR